ncbi:MAG: GNAT family N-acetyltransferase [Gammaproteobacteria bacterium]|nr:GNAT family N-acetyltransferase [Gammaproteobacteria bacterium]
MTGDDNGYRFAYREHARALYHTLGEDAFYITMEQSVSEENAQYEALLRYLDYSMVEADEYGLLHFPETQRQGVAIWLQPLAIENEARKKRAKFDFLHRHMGAASASTYNDIVDFMSARSDALIDTSAWYLSIVGIFPAFQNQGLGNSLIGATLEQADRTGVTTFLETFTPRNEPFYRRLGYRVVARLFEPTIAANYSLMVRERGGTDFENG